MKLRFRRLFRITLPRRNNNNVKRISNIERSTGIPVLLYGKGYELLLTYKGAFYDRGEQKAEES